MHARRFVVVALALCLGSPVLAMQSAAAATGITVSPHDNLFAGQTVTVTGSGWAPVALNVIQCGYSNRSICTAPVIVTPDEDGTFSTPFVVRAIMGGGDDCSSAPGACFIQVEERFTSCCRATAPLSFRPYPTDAQIKNRATGVLTGDDIYTLPPFASRQTRAPRPIARGETWTFALRFENDGDVTDTFKVTAPAGASPIAIQYFFGFYDVTAQVTGGGLTHTLAPGAAFMLAIRFAADLDAGPGPTTRNALIVLTSQGLPAAKDCVQVGVVIA